MKNKNEQIVQKGLLHTYINYAALIRAQANQPTFKSTVKKYKVIKAQKLGGISKGCGKQLKLTGFKQLY